MELVSVLRVLMRHPLLIALGVVAAAIGGFAASGAVGPLGSSERHSTPAFTQIHVDTPKSLAVDLQTSGEAIITQASVLANLLGDSRSSAAIARRAGIAPARLGVVLTSQAEPQTVSPLATRGAEVATTPQRAYTLAVATSGELPIIDVEAAGPDPRVTRRLAEASTAVLQSLTAAGAQNPRHQISVRALGPVRLEGESVSGGASGLIGLVAFVVLSAMACGAIVLGAGIARAWRGLAA